METSQNVGTKSAFKVYHAIKKNTRHMGSKFIVQKHYAEKINTWEREREREREREITGLRVDASSLRIGREKSSMAKKKKLDIC